MQDLGLTGTFIGAGALLALLGVPLAMRRVPRNHWYGVRLPSTLRSDLVWYEVNARLGMEFLVLGTGVVLLTLALGWLRLQLHVQALICCAVLVTGALASTAHAVLLARRLTRAAARRGPPGPA